MPKLPEMKPVVSSMFRTVGYDTDEQDLYIQFNNMSIYKYKKVSQDLHGNMMRNESIGKYFNNNIKYSHDHEKVQ